MQVGTARLLRDSFPGQHERVMLKLDATPELQFLYLQGVLQQAQRYATPVAAGSDNLPFAEQIVQALPSALPSALHCTCLYIVRAFTLYLPFRCTELA